MLMRVAVLLLSLLVPATALASTRLLLLEDIGSEQADFSWNPIYGGGVEFSASHPVCWGDDCYGFHRTGRLEGFELDSRDVYYVGGADRVPVLWRRTRGWFEGPRFTDACRIRVEPERVCQVWYSSDDCVQSVIKYRVYIDIESRKLAEGEAPTPVDSAGF